MNEREKLERIFMAAETKSESGRLDGPFASASEAEIAAQKLGWEWVLVYVHVLNDKGKIIDITKRFYQPTKPEPPKYQNTAAPSRTPAQIMKLLRSLRTPDVPAMSAADKAFFAPYETQMREFNAKK